MTEAGQKSSYQKVKLFLIITSIIPAKDIINLAV